jgi:hypothetical protein
MAEASARRRPRRGDLLLQDAFERIAIVTPTQFLTFRPE